MSKLLSVSQVAKQLSVCTETVYRALWSGKLRGTKLVIGGWRIAEADLKSFVDEGTCPADEREELAAILHGTRRRNRGFVVGNTIGSAFAWSLLCWFLVATLGGVL